MGKMILQKDRQIAETYPTQNQSETYPTQYQSETYPIQNQSEIYPTQNQAETIQTQNQAKTYVLIEIKINRLMIIKWLESMDHAALHLQ